MNAKQKSIRNVLIFTLLVNGLAWLGPVLGGSPTEPGLGLLVWGTAPLVATLIMKLLLRDKTSLGLRPNLTGDGSRRSYLLSLLLYPAAIIIVIVAGYVLGAMQIETMPAAEFVSALLPLVVTYFIFGFFEEIGWRGYLTPAVNQIHKGLLGYVIVGLIWASWHFPYINELWAHTNAELTTLLPRFILGTMISTVVYGEIRMRSGSVWPAVLMHWIGNTLANGLLTTIVVLVPGREWLGSFGVEGALMMIIFAVVGERLYHTRREHANLPSSLVVEQAT